MAAADRARSLSLGRNITLLSGLVLAQAGEERRALGLAAELETRIETEPQLYSRLIRGEVALKRKNAREALSHFGEANALSDSWLGRYGLGRAYLVADAFTEAHAEFEACLKRRGEATAVLIDEIPSYRVLPPLHYYLGRAHEGLGSPDAAESYRNFLGIKQGDEDPLVADARRRLAGRYAAGQDILLQRHRGRLVGAPVVQAQHDRVAALAAHHPARSRGSTRRGSPVILNWSSDRHSTSTQFLAWRSSLWSSSRSRRSSPNCRLSEPRTHSILLRAAPPDHSLLPTRPLRAARSAR